MGRIRTVKPDFFRSRSMARCTHAARLTFEGLWCEADDLGHGIADTRLIKGAVWPVDDDITADDIEGHLGELERTGHIWLYELDGDRFYAVIRWEKHQSAAYRRGEAVHPLPPGRTSLHDSAPPVVQECAGSGREVEGRGGEVPRRLLHHDLLRADAAPPLLEESDALIAELTAETNASTVDEAVRSLLDQRLRYAWPSDLRRALRVLLPAPAPTQPKAEWVEAAEEQARADRQNQAAGVAQVKAIGEGVEQDPAKRRAILDRVRAKSESDVA